GKAGSERQLINVAAGNISSSSTDAVNGSQLYATNNMINTVANSVKAVIGTPATLSNKGTFTITNLGGTGKTTIDEAIKASITEVQAGNNVTVSNTPGANGQKIYTVNGEKTTLSAGSTDVSVTPGTKDSNNVTNYTVDLSTTTKNTIAQHTTDIDANKANIAKNTADIGANTAKINDNATAIAKNATDIATNKADIATNKADIAANKTAIADNTTAITNLGNNTFTLNGDSTSTTAQTLNKNGGLSFKVAGDGKYISTAAAGDTVTVSLNEQAIKDTAKSSVKFKVKANANAEEVVNADDTIAFNDGNNIEITQNGKEFTIATKKDVTFDSVTANTFTAGTNVLNGTGLTVGNTVITTVGLINGNTTITGTGVTTDTVTAGTVNAGSVTADAATIGGKVSINNAGINAGNTVITNVAAGTADTDAVNVGQLKQQIKEATDTKNIRINYKANGGASESVSLSDGFDFKDGHLTTTEVGPNGTVKVNVVEGKIDITNGTAMVSQSGVATVSDVADAINHVQTSVSNGRINFSGDNKDAADPSTTLSRGFNQALEFVGGADVANLSDRNIGVNVVGNKMEIKLAKDLTGLTSSTFTDGTGNTTVVNGAGISIQGPTGNSQASAPVTLTANGLDNGGNRIANVADGVASTDVATVGQLRNMGSNTAMAITNLQRESQRIGAQSAAMAALKPIQYDPLEPTQIMAGIGNYRGETAGALGIAHYTNENTMFHIGATIGNDNNMVNAGVTHKFGSSAEKEAIPERYKAGPISSMYVMQTEMSQLQKENTEQKEVIAAQQHRLSTMETENAQQKQQLDAQQKSIDELKEAVAALLARG
ncbi:MAG: YadA-like family protein, partial [Veillonella caviae]|nr:YadA-like family protein [Veillonella caviae]